MTDSTTITPPLNYKIGNERLIKVTENASRKLNSLLEKQGRATGALRIAKAYSVLECGQALVPEVVRGQAQGGFAMGVGYALLESLPPFEGGPGNGQWNLGQYILARGSDLPLHDFEIEMLPPLADEPPKGIAEVVMIPVVSALVNAIFDATGRRFRSLPVTQDLLKGALA